MGVSTSGDVPCGIFIGSLCCPPVCARSGSQVSRLLVGMGSALRYARRVGVRRHRVSMGWAGMRMGWAIVGMGRACVLVLRPRVSVGWAIVSVGRHLVRCERVLAFPACGSCLIVAVLGKEEFAIYPFPRASKEVGWIDRYRGCVNSSYRIRRIKDDPAYLGQRSKDIKQLDHLLNVSANQNNFVERHFVPCSLFQDVTPLRLYARHS